MAAVAPMMVFLQAIMETVFSLLSKQPLLPLQYNLKLQVPWPFRSAIEFVFFIEVGTKTTPYFCIGKKSTRR